MQEPREFDALIAIVDNDPSARKGLVLTFGGLGNCFSRGAAPTITRCVRARKMPGKCRQSRQVAR
jgi:hypothetical protein